MNCKGCDSEQYRPSHNTKGSKLNDNRVVSGMRPTGRLHLGHYHGALKNWAELQHQYECFFFVADWHALTTGYQYSSSFEQNTYDMLVDWFAAGISPSACTVFLQSKVPEQTVLHVLLSMITPLSWLERVPTYKDTIKRLNDRNLATYGFLGYPVLQSADILMYRGTQVPVGADQVAHVELTREIARSFNFAFGRGEDWETEAQKAIQRLPKKLRQQYLTVRKQFTQHGNSQGLSKISEQLKNEHYLTEDELERLTGFLEDGGRSILPEPQVLLTTNATLPGLDGEKMSKSYNNTIFLREEEGMIEKKVRTMKTDPARMRRTDPGDPDKCPVFSLHKVYSEKDTCEWASNGCKSASIGCLDCKGPLIDALAMEQKQFQERAQPYLDDREVILHVIQEGSERARTVAKETLDDVKSAVGLSF